jgi:uncharacterized membrane protein YfcA
MKREYFTGLFLVIFISIIIIATYTFDEQIVEENLLKFIVVWLLLAIYVGQYSMKFPKKF